MRGLTRKSAVFATTAAIAFSVTAAPVAASADHGHHKDWTDKQCRNQSARWTKAHKHPTAKQTKQENNLLKKHGCTETV
jgi:Ni/Co efflux regulator RcnB